MSRYARRDSHRLLPSVDSKNQREISPLQCDVNCRYAELRQRSLGRVFDYTF